MSRPRRTRPEPHQLEALKKLFVRTSNPSIEERGALALEIGMYVSYIFPVELNKAAYSIGYIKFQGSRQSHELVP
jgi:hypothetical protein